MNLIPTETNQYINADHIVSFQYTPVITEKRKVGEDKWGDPEFAQFPVESSIRITMSTGKDVFLSGKQADAVYEAVLKLQVIRPTSTSKA